MFRKPSKNWLQSFISRQSSASDVLARSNSDASRTSSSPVDQQAIAERIAYDAYSDSPYDDLSVSQATPRSITLEAQRTSRMEEYRLEEQQRQAADEARKLAAQPFELQAKLMRLECSNQDKSRFEPSPESSNLEPDPGSSLQSDMGSRLGSSAQDNCPLLPFTDDASSAPITQAQTQNRHDRRRQAKRRARSRMTGGQRIKHGIRSVFKRWVNGIFWGLSSLVKLLGKLLLAIARLLIAAIVGLCRWIAPIVRRRWWTFLSGGIIALALGTAGGAIWWLTKAPPAPQCDKIAAWSADSERLSCAQIAADSGNLGDILKGIALVQDWQLGHPLHNEAQGLLKRWTASLLLLSREKLDQQDLDGAIAIAKKVPKDSPLYTEVQQEIIGWQEAKNIGQKIYDTFQAALKKQAWDDASVALSKLANINDPTWQKRLAEFRTQLNAEKMANVTLKQARDFAKANPPEQWGSAIALTDPINRKTFVWETARKDIELWRTKVFDLAIVYLMDRKKPAMALALVKTIPSNIDLSPEQNNFAHLAQASEIVSSNDNAPMLQQLGRIALGHHLIAQIPEGSRFRTKAIALLPQLDSQGEDVVQIEMARSLAELGPLPFINGAIAQAEQVSPKNPRRIQAQTLIAQWKKEVQRREDAPLLAQGQLLAKGGGVAQFRQAADLMDRVLSGRSLYAEAQRRKSTWIAQAQTLEDQPILNQARAQANSGNLGQAMQTAKRVASGRALYAQARREMGGWGDQLQAINDRAIMDRAAALAAKGNLTQAIDTASEVSSSSVGDEARSSTLQWSIERESIRRSQAPAPPEPTRSVDLSPPAASIEPSRPLPIEPAIAPPLPIRTESDPAPSPPVPKP